MEAQQNPAEGKRLAEGIVSNTDITDRREDEPFFYLIDHCFAIKGKGTIVTGTVLQGKIKKGDDIELPEIGFKNKIKSMQMFKKDIQEVRRGDRVGMLINALLPDQLERGIGTKPGYLKKSNTIIANLQKVRYWKHEIKSKMKYHVTVGHLTTMAKLFLLKGKSEGPLVLGETYESVDEIGESEKEIDSHVHAVLFLEKPCYLREESFFIGSRLELSIDTKECRMAFCGTAQHLRMIDEGAELDDITLTKAKKKEGVIERVANDGGLIMKDMFTKESKLQQFIGKEVKIEGLDIPGKIQGTFGNAGKIRVTLNNVPAPGQLEGIEGKKVTLEYVKVSKLRA